MRHAVGGEIAMLPETMAVYRRHAHGIWHPRTLTAEILGAHEAMDGRDAEAMLDLFTATASARRSSVRCPPVLREIGKTPADRVAPCF